MVYHYPIIKLHL